MKTLTPSDREEKCKNGKNCPYCLLATNKFELCEQEILRDVKKLFRPFCYWVNQEKDHYKLIIFHGRIGRSYSDGWAVKDLEILKPVVNYLKSQKVEMGDYSLII